MLVREGAAGVSEALLACGFDPSHNDVWFGGWSASVRSTAGEPGVGLRATVVLPRTGGKDLLFDTESRKVLQVSSRLLPPEYEHLRRAFSAHVPSAPFEVLPERDRILEPFVEGRLLSHVDEDVLLRSVSELLHRLPEVSREFGEGNSVDRLTVAIDAADPGLGAHQARKEIVSWLGTAPQVPAHGDLSVENVIVTADGPVCIDFGNTSIRPAWSDGLMLAMQALRRLEGSNEGRFGLLDSLLREFLGRTIPVPLPHDWRRLAALGLLAMEGNWSCPSQAWVGQRD